MSEFHIPPVPPIPGQEQKPAAISYERPVMMTYLWMAAGLLLSAACAFLLNTTGLLYTLAGSGLIFVPLVAQLIVVVAFSAMMRTASPTALKGMFMVYAALTGFSLALICEAYTDSTVFIAFGISAVYFLCLVAIGMTTKLDLTKLGVLCLVGLVVLMISQLVMMLFQTPMSIRLYSILGLVLFTGITAWDTNRLQKVMVSTEGQPIEQERWSIYFALQLYLDFINIFLYILRLVGMGSKSSK